MSAPKNIKIPNNLSQFFGHKCQSKFTPPYVINKQSLQHLAPTKPPHPQFPILQSSKHAHTHPSISPLIPLQQSQTFPYIPNQQNINSSSSSSHDLKLQSIPMCQSEYQWLSCPEKHEIGSKNKKKKQEDKIYMYVKSINMMENTLMKAITHFKIHFMQNIHSHYSNHQSSENRNKNKHKNTNNNRMVSNTAINQTIMNSVECANNKHLNQKECFKNEDQKIQQKVEQSFESELAVSPPSTKYPSKQILMPQQPKTYHFKQSHQIRIPHLQTYQYVQHCSPTQKTHKCSPQIQSHLHQHQHQRQFKSDSLYPYYQKGEQANFKYHRASYPLINNNTTGNKRFLMNSPSPQNKVYLQYQLQSPKQTLSRPLSQPCLIRPASSLPQTTAVTTNRPQSNIPNKHHNLYKNNENSGSNIKNNGQNVRDQYYITNKAIQYGIQTPQLKYCKSNPNFYIPQSHRLQTNNQFQIKPKPQSKFNNNPWQEYAQLDQTIINQLNTEISSYSSHQLNNRKQQNQPCLSYEHRAYHQQRKKREQRGSYDIQQKDIKRHPIYMEYRDNIHDKIKAAQRQKLTVVTKSIKHCKP